MSKNDMSKNQNDIVNVNCDSASLFNIKYIETLNERIF